MEFRYENEQVKKYFSDFGLMQRKIGKDLAKSSKKRYDSLKASANFSIYLSTSLGKPHPLYGDLKRCYGISISGNVRLVVKPNTYSIEPASLKECDTVIIKGVVDYHGQKQEWLIP